MALHFQPYGDPLAGEKLKQDQFDRLNQTLNNVSQQQQQQYQFGKEQALRDAQNQREQGVYNFDYGQPPGQQSSAPSQNPLASLPAQSPWGGEGVANPQYASAGVSDTGQGLSMPKPMFQGPQQGSAIVAQHKEMFPHLANISSQAANGTPQYDETGAFKNLQQTLTNPNIGQKYKDAARTNYSTLGAADTDLEMKNPNSPISKVTQAFAKDIMPEINTDGIPAEHLMKLDPMISNYVTKKLAAELRLQGINARQNQSAGKEDLSSLKDVQNNFNKDKNVVSVQGTLDKLQQAKGLLEAGNVNNATAKQALQTALTFVSTGAQRVNESELKAFGGAKTITNRANQWIQGIDAGTLTPRDYQDMKQVIGIYENAAKGNLQDRGLSYAKQLSQRTGKDAKAEYKRVTGDDYQDQSQPQPGQSTQIGRFKVTVH